MRLGVFANAKKVQREESATIRSEIENTSQHYPEADFFAQTSGATTLCSIL
jgi:hypothetical protein